MSATHWVEVIDDGLMREMTRGQVEYLARQAEREEFDRKHPRCEVCGQFLGGASHFYQDYWGEWDHV